MQKSRVKLISFDCGGTLYYEVEPDFVVFHRILGKLGYSFEVSKVQEALDAARDWWRYEKLKNGRIWDEDTWKSLIQRMVLNLSLEDTGLVAKRLINGWLLEAEFRAYDDAAPTLTELKRRGFKVIAISNVSSKRNLMTYLRKASLLEYFDTFIASGDVRHEKPDTEIFEIASKLSKVPLSEMLHVGDKYEEDYSGAQSAGMQAILIDRKGVYSNVNCKKISELTELLEMPFIASQKRRPKEWRLLL